MLEFPYTRAMGKSIRLMLVGALCVAPALASASDWLLDGTVGLIAYDNAARSRLASDHRSATALEIDVAGHYQPATRTAGVLSFEAWGGADRYDRFHGLNQVRAGVGATYFARIGLGPSVPWWSASIRAGYHDFEHSLRDGAEWQMTLAVGKSVSDLVDLTTRATVRRRRADSPVFSSDTLRLGFEVDYRVPAGTVFGGLSWQRGDLASSIAGPGNVGPVWVDDPTFGATWRSYRVDADVLATTLGAQLPVGAMSHLVLAWERLDGRARPFPADYDGNIYRVQLTHEF